MNPSFNFRKVNIFLAWTAFIISLTLYLSTLEPTVSFWDCGEFLSCAAKLEVPHAPGAPFFILLGRVAAMLNPSNPTVMINGLSAVASAFTIFFLFLTISWFGRKLFAKTFEQSKVQEMVILAASFIGAMAYAVSDSFWFSAVETEVYALSSLFTAVVFWCITKWEENYADNTISNRWLLLIAYLFGLSVGVHLLNLLAIPAIVLVYFLKKYPANLLVILKSLVVAVLFLAGFLVLIPGIPAILSSFELLAVNHMGLPLNSGLITGIVFIAFMLYAMRIYFFKKGKAKLCNAILYLTFVIIGFSSYCLVLVRSNDNPPIDMNNPDNPFALENYLNREQYGKRPLLYGQSFASPAIATNERNTYNRYDGRYIKSPLNPEVVYDQNTLMLFPRLSDDTPEYTDAYKQWIGNYKGRPYFNNATGKQIQIPTFSENIKFLFKYQLGHMYFRYFMWNFAGRQNDILGRGNAMNGNWISGIPVLDRFRLGQQDNLPTHLKENRARNRYFLIPLLLGLFGLAYQFKTDRKQFWIATLLFFFTGIAIALYLNEIPVIPRERDYVYVGSFYVFAIWIGIGAMAVYAWFVKRFSNDKLSAAIAICIALSVPVIMVVQNYDDHDRSGRYGVLEYTRNYLESCEPNAILFTNADNDTYPLWYAQEVKGIRRDIRIVLLPYLAADWYVEQMRRPFYNQSGIRMNLSQDKYIGGQRVYLPIVERTDSAVDINELLEFIGSDDPRVKLDLTTGEKINYIPSRNIYLPAPKHEALPRNFTGAKAVDSIDIQIKGSHLRMDNLVLLDIIASNNWERPVYFASLQEPMNFGLQQYLQLDGYAYKLIPAKGSSNDYNNVGCIDVERLYRQYMNDFSFATIENPKIYLDNTHINILNVVSLRNKFVRLAGELIKTGDTARAEKVLDRIVHMLPDSRLSLDLYNLEIAKLYLQMGKKEKGRDELAKLKTFCNENIGFYNQLPKSQLGGVNYEIRLILYMLQQIADIAASYSYNDLVKECDAIWKNSTKRLISEIGIPDH